MIIIKNDNCQLCNWFLSKCLKIANSRNGFRLRNYAHWHFSMLDWRIKIGIFVEATKFPLSSSAQNDVENKNKNNSKRTYSHWLHRTSIKFIKKCIEMQNSFLDTNRHVFSTKKRKSSKKKTELKPYARGVEIKVEKF